MTPEDKQSAREIFEGRVQNANSCVFCAGLHATVVNIDPWYQPCPRIKKIERFQSGELTSVEFWPPGTWETNVVFPEDVYEEDDSDASST